MPLSASPHVYSARAKAAVVSRLYTSETTKIFGIGLNKTGTRSVASALRLLGFRTLHRGDARASTLVDQAIDDGRRPLTLLGEDFEAYFDVASIVRNFDIVDREYPGSKFILTTSADVESWLESRRRHVEANRRNKEYDGPWHEVDEVGWVKEWEAHHAAVRRHFANRPEDLLVFDVRAGHGWERLSPFVGMPEPSRRFPWLNSAGRGTYSGDPYLDVLRRRFWAIEGVVRRRMWRSRRLF